MSDNAGGAASRKGTCQSSASSGFGHSGGIAHEKREDCREWVAAGAGRVDPLPPRGIPENCPHGPARWAIEPHHFCIDCKQAGAASGETLRCVFCKLIVTPEQRISIGEKLTPLEAHLGCYVRNEFIQAAGAGDKHATDRELDRNSLDFILRTVRRLGCNAGCEHNEECEQEKIEDYLRRAVTAHVAAALEQVTQERDYAREAAITAFDDGRAYWDLDAIKAEARGQAHCRVASTGRHRSRPTGTKYLMPDVADAMMDLEGAPQPSAPKEGE